MERDSFDAWGKLRSATYWSDDTNNSISSVTTRGFTGHEMVQNTASGFELINMNARMYDPTTGRFISPDRLIQQATNLQEYNPYSYVLNNPLSAVDPTGMCGGFFGFAVCPVEHAISAVGSFLNHNQILGNLITVAAGASCGPFGSLCAAGAASTIAFAETGRVAPALEAGAITGAEAEAFNLVGDYTNGHFGELGPSGDETLTQYAESAQFEENLAGHGLVGGLASRSEGGSFQSGFLAAGFADAAGFGAGIAFPSTTVGLNAGALAATSVTGGLASEIGGGSFANGAETGAFGYLFNSEGGKIAGRIVGGLVGEALGLGPEDPAADVAAAALGKIGGDVGDALTGPDESSQSTYDTTGGMKGIGTNATPDQVISTLESNGYMATQTTGSNGAVTVLQNEEGSTYTIYTRSSTGASGMSYRGPSGQLSKYNLGQ